LTLCLNKHHVMKVYGVWRYCSMHF